MPDYRRYVAFLDIYLPIEFSDEGSVHILDQHHRALYTLVQVVKKLELVMVEVSVLDSDHFLRDKRLTCMDLSDICEIELNYHALSLNYDVVFESDVNVLVEERLTPGLARFGEIAGTSEFFQLSLHQHQQSLNCCSLFEDNLVCFFVLHSHAFKKCVLISFEQVEEKSVLLNDAFHIIFEHDLPEIGTNDLGQGLSAQHLNNHIFFSPHSHFSHCVVVKGVLPKTFTFIDFSLLKIALKQCRSTFFDGIKRRSWISFLNYVLALVVAESHKRRGHLLLLLRAQELVEGHPLQKLLICLKLADDDFFDSFPETNSVDDPKSTLLYGCRS